MCCGCGTIEQPMSLGGGTVRNDRCSENRHFTVTGRANSTRVVPRDRQIPFLQKNPTASWRPPE